MVCSLTLDGFSTRMKARERKGEKLWRAIRARIVPNDTSYINRKLAFLPAIQKINQTMILQIQFTCLNALDQRHNCRIHPCKRLFCVHLLRLSTTYLPGCKHSHLQVRILAWDLYNRLVCIEQSGNLRKVIIHDSPGPLHRIKCKLTGNWCKPTSEEITVQEMLSRLECWLAGSWKLKKEQDISWRHMVFP